MIDATAFYWLCAPGFEFERKAIIKKSSDLRVDIVLDHTARNGRQVKEGLSACEALHSDHRVPAPASCRAGFDPSSYVVR